MDILVSFAWSVSESFLRSQQEIISTLYPCHSLVRACVLGPDQGAWQLAFVLFVPTNPPQCPFIFLRCSSVHPSGPGFHSGSVPLAQLARLSPSPQPPSQAFSGPVLSDHLPFSPLLAPSSQLLCPDPCLDLLSIPLAHSLCLTPLPGHLATMLLFPTQILLLYASRHPACTPRVSWQLQGPWSEPSPRSLFSRPL